MFAKKKAKIAKRIASIHLVIENYTFETDVPTEVADGLIEIIEHLEDIAYLVGGEKMITTTRKCLTELRRKGGAE